MLPALEGTRVAVIGGDARELVLVEELVKSGAQVNVAGLPAGEIKGVCHFSAAGDCLGGIKALILPVPGIDENGRVYSAFAEKSPVLTDEVMAEVPPGALVFTGVARPLLSRMVSRRGLRLIELMKLNEVAILNSIPSAEGAIQMAMEMLPVTIHGITAYVLGFGRTGMTLARLLGAMGARTRVVARKPEHLARIFEMNLIPVPLQHMADCLGEAEVIFNTIPALVLTREVLMKLSPGTVIIDIASAPGGTDFRAAESLGIKACLAPGLPGKVAPKTAGHILARVISRIIAEETAGG